jgi:hypothetical protein
VARLYRSPKRTPALSVSSANQSIPLRQSRWRRVGVRRGEEWDRDYLRQQHFAETIRNAVPSYSLTKSNVTAIRSNIPDADRNILSIG